MQILAWLVVFLTFSAVLLPLSARADETYDDEDVEVDDDEEVGGTEDVAVDEGEDEVDDEDEGEQTISASADVSASYLFPAYPTQRLELGEKNHLTGRLIEYRT